MTTKMKRAAAAFVILAGIFVFPLVSHAAPAISGVQGTISNGTSITITGSGFGATGPTIQVFDDFDKGATNSKISTTSGSAQVGQWEYVQGASSEIIYSTEYAHSGSQSVRINCAYSQCDAHSGKAAQRGRRPGGILLLVAIPADEQKCSGDRRAGGGGSSKLEVFLALWLGWLFQKRLCGYASCFHLPLFGERSQHGSGRSQWRGFVAGVRLVYEPFQ